MLLLTFGTVVIALWHTMFRGFEAWLATLALAPIVQNQVPASGYRYFVWTGPDTLVALQVTLECTALIFTVPVTIAAAAALGFTRAPWWRVFAAISTLWLIILAVNTLRLWVIGWATQTWGMDPGYTISHTLVGSIIGIIGFVLGVATLFLVLGFRRPRAKK
jgi:exosortase/archaeosortase family protein